MLSLTSSKPTLNHEAAAVEKLVQCVLFMTVLQRVLMGCLEPLDCGPRGSTKCSKSLKLALLKPGWETNTVSPAYEHTC